MERARVIAWEPKWSAGATCPVVLASDRGLTLLYNVALEEEESVGVVTFHRDRAHRFSGINDEILSGHPLYGKGLDPYSAHEVENSAWLKELQKVHSVHDRYDPTRWASVKHYILCFHDDMLEVLADGFTVEKRSGTVKEVLTGFVPELAI
ncbi:MAG: hypothetical protein H6592_06585 [Flavobacteriales bacterium]|nr:hypothetical protein [Flavobacteriales bacterium]